VWGKRGRPATACGARVPPPGAAARRSTRAGPALRPQPRGAHRPTPPPQASAPRRTPLRIQNLRVNNVEIPNGKRIEISLQYIYGIGQTTAQTILRETVRAAPSAAPRLRQPGAAHAALASRARRGTAEPADGEARVAAQPARSAGTGGRELGAAAAAAGSRGWTPRGQMRTRLQLHPWRSGRAGAARCACCSGAAREKPLPVLSSPATPHRGPAIPPGCGEQEDLRAA
jgi:hypothetical protein